MLPLSIYLFIIHVAISRQYCFSRDSTPPLLKREQNKSNNPTRHSTSSWELVLYLNKCVINIVVLLMGILLLAKLIYFRTIMILCYG
jgi:hypothetical protein